MNFIQKYLPIIFGCHGRADRSFYFRGEKFPICARCTGELIGIIFSIIFYNLYCPSVFVNLILLIPLILDGVIQLLTKYESNNFKRLITGLLFGYALCNLFIQSIVFTMALGYEYAKSKGK